MIYNFHVTHDQGHFLPLDGSDKSSILQSRVKAPGGHISKADGSIQETIVCQEDIPRVFQVFESDIGSEGYDKSYLGQNQMW